MFLEIHIPLEMFLAYVTFELWLILTHMNGLYVVIQVQFHAVNFGANWTLKLLSNFFQIIWVMVPDSAKRDEQN